MNSGKRAAAAQCKQGLKLSSNVDSGVLRRDKTQIPSFTWSHAAALCPFKLADGVVMRVCSSNCLCNTKEGEEGRVEKGDGGGGGCLASCTPEWVFLSLEEINVGSSELYSTSAQLLISFGKTTVNILIAVDSLAPTQRRRAELLHDSTTLPNVFFFANVFPFVKASCRLPIRTVVPLVLSSAVTIVNNVFLTRIFTMYFGKTISDQF